MLKSATPVKLKTNQLLITKIKKLPVGVLLTNCKLILYE